MLHKACMFVYIDKILCGYDFSLYNFELLDYFYFLISPRFNVWGEIVPSTQLDRVNSRLLFVSSHSR